MDIEIKVEVLDFADFSMIGPALIEVIDAVEQAIDDIDEDAVVAVNGKTFYSTGIEVTATFDTEEAVERFDTDEDEDEDEDMVTTYYVKRLSENKTYEVEVIGEAGGALMCRDHTTNQGMVFAATDWEYVDPGTNGV